MVAVMPPEAGNMLSRPLVYTALTRARRHLSVVHAAGPALARAVREIGSIPRRTRLAALLRTENWRPRPGPSGARWTTGRAVPMTNCQGIGMTAGCSDPADCRFERVPSATASPSGRRPGWRPPHRRRRWAPSDEFEYQPLRIDARVSRSAAASMLAIRAEFSGWELARVLRFPDGSRRVWLRRSRSPALLPDLIP